MPLQYSVSSFIHIRSTMYVRICYVNGQIFYSEHRHKGVYIHVCIRHNKGFWQDSPWVVVLIFVSKFITSADTTQVWVQPHERQIPSLGILFQVTIPLKQLVGYREISEKHLSFCSGPINSSTKYFNFECWFWECYLLSHSGISSLVTSNHTDILVQRIKSRKIDLENHTFWNSGVDVRFVGDRRPGEFIHIGVTCKIVNNLYQLMAQPWGSAKLTKVIAIFLAKIFSWKIV